MSGLWYELTRPRRARVVVPIVLGFSLLLGLWASAQAAGLGPLTDTLTQANQEARGSIVPAVAAILAVIVLIGVGAGLVRVISRST